MMTAIASHILALPLWAALLVVFALPALESSAFVGFIFPGEIALILGGVLAYEGRVPLVAVLAAGIAGAIVGDSIGYGVGRRFGRGILDGTLGRLVHSRHLDRAEVYLAERGGKAVFFGRFTAALRVMIPGLAGMSGLRYRTFLAFNVASAVAWGTLSVMLGYLGGSSWQHVEHIASRIGLVALAALVLAGVGGVLLRRTGPDRFKRAAAALGSSSPVRLIRERFPHTSGWVVARLDATGPTGLALTAAIAVAIAATWIALGISQDVLGHEELALLDPRIHQWVLAHRTPGLDVFFEIVTWLGATAVTVPVLTVVGIVLARRRRSWAPVLDIAVVYGTAVFLHAVVGQVVHRSRPPATDWLVSAHGWAYPSGHTTQAVAAWGILAVLVASPRNRFLAGAAAAVIAILVAASRVYVGVHWTTDVLAGAAMATAILALWSGFRQSWFATNTQPDISHLRSICITTGGAHSPGRDNRHTQGSSAGPAPRRNVVREKRSPPTSVVQARGVKATASSSPAGPACADARLPSRSAPSDVGSGCAELPVWGGTLVGMRHEVHATTPANTEVRGWFRAYGLQVVLAIGLYGAAVVVAGIYHLPVRDPDDSIVGPFYIRLPLIAVACFLIDVGARCLHGGLVGWRSRIPAVVRERWHVRRVRLVLIGMGSWYLAYVGFRNLKSYVPFVRPHLMDDDLLRLDRKLAFGHDPATLLHDLLGTGVTAHLMSITYVAWIVFLTLSLLIALFWTSNLDTACWYVTAVAVNWVLGVSIYYLVPSTGPIYAHPAMFADLPHTQVTDIARSWLADRTDMLADPFGTSALQTIAAFASLHVSVMVTASLIAMMIKLRPAFLQWALWLFLVLNILATVYLGWHYVLDVFGGMAIGLAAVWTAAWGTGNQHRLPALLSLRHEHDNVLTSEARVSDKSIGIPGLARPERERFWTWATVVTMVRTIGSLTLIVLAIRGHSMSVLLGGLAVYWVGDILDGWLARRLDQETRIGAVADILSDRLSVVPFFVGVVWLERTWAVPVGVYLAEFLVVDLLLSLAFLAWPLVSPNYFYLVDHRIWCFNWSPLAKALNSAAFIGILLLTQDAVLATAFALALLMLKCLSVARLLRVGLPAAAARDRPFRNAVPQPTRRGSW
jgi:undecaprenyl-diphosphatase